jgi:MSHA biogenesis protein MshI
LFSFIRKKKNVPGLTAAVPQADGVCVVRVVRESTSRPRVTVFAFHAWDSAADHATLWTSLCRDYDLSHASCVTLLDPGDYSLLLTEAPDVPREELKSAIRWRIKDLIDFHIDDATLDVFSVPGAAGSGRAHPMYAVAARTSAIRERVDAMEAAGIGLEIVDIPEMAQRNLASVLPQDETGVVLLSLGRRTGLITISCKGELYLSRNLDMGWEQLMSESDPLLADYGSIVLEVQRSLDYYDSHFRQPPVAGLMLAPMRDDPSGLMEQLRSNLGLSVDVLDPSVVLDWEVDAPAPMMVDCAIALGAALRREERVL